MTITECDLGEHHWHRRVEGVTMCLVCRLDANELILGLRADEAALRPQEQGDGGR